MKQTLFLLTVFFLIVSCGPQQRQSDEKQENQVQKAKIHNVNSSKFHELSQSGNGIVLDVRTLAESQQGHIPNAIVIDIYQKDFENKIQSLPRDKEIYVYCTVGARSSQAAYILQENGFEKIYNLDGGIIDWAKNGYPISK